MPTDSCRLLSPVCGVRVSGPINNKKVNPRRQLLPTTDSDRQAACLASWRLFAVSGFGAGGTNKAKWLFGALPTIGP